MKITLLTLISTTLLFSAVDVKTINSKPVLSVNTAEEVMGIQFDLKYNPTELSFNGAESMLEGITFQYKDKGDGIVRGLMFSMDGMVLNSNLNELISFDFTPVNGYRGESQVNFSDLILAGNGGSQIEASLPSFVVDTNSLLPQKTQLSSVYPNPFNPSTALQYEIAVEAMVNISVFDLSGRLVETLKNGNMEPGSYNITWDASSLASGTYFIHFTSGNYNTNQKVQLIK
ncbi:MAG: T9SS type A sorting domain-containing protein [Candidatus Marinimicrobia bacterium]|nr:T9SS type A sorting domain-containing protein [Candidatus Neomarinimicrobiota bacterium]